MGVSLVAVAAIAASLLLTRQRLEKLIPGVASRAGESSPARPVLDAIRAAGL